MLDKATFNGLFQLEILSLTDNRIAALSPDLFLHNGNLRQLDLSNNSLGKLKAPTNRKLGKLNTDQ